MTGGEIGDSTGLDGGKAHRRGPGAPSSPRIDGPAFEALIREQVPFIGAYDIRVEELGIGRMSLSLPFGESFLRPGGSISGPVLFALADVALYGAIMTRLGRTDMAVTSSMTINFLRRPPPDALLATGQVLKLGRRLAYGEVVLRSASYPNAEPVAHATGTYAIPPG